MKFLIILTFLSLYTSAFPAEVIVKMLNKSKSGERMVFEPSLVKVTVGDTVKFIPISKGHSIQSLKQEKSRPVGALKMKSKKNKEYIYKVEQEGIHVFKCKPHYVMGMIGMIVAGKPINLTTIKKIKIKGKKAKVRFIKMIKSI